MNRSQLEQWVHQAVSQAVAPLTAKFEAELQSLRHALDEALSLINTQYATPARHLPAPLVTGGRCRDGADAISAPQAERLCAEPSSNRVERAGQTAATCAPLTPNHPPEPSAAQSWQAMLAEGERAQRAWVDNGLLIGSADLASGWAQTRQALEQAVATGRLFVLKIGGRNFYPAAFQAIAAEDAKAVCVQLKEADATAKFIFWNKAHGTLGGKLPAEAIRSGQREKVIQLARAWSAERGLADPGS